MRLVDRLTIRARITIGTLLVAALFFGGVALVVRHQVEGILRDALSEVLASDAAPFETAIQQEPGDAIDSPGEGQLVAVIDPSGDTKVTTLPSGVGRALESLDLRSTGPREITTKAGTYLVAIETVASAEGDWTIVAARNQDASNLILADLTTGLIVGLGVLTALFGIVSWLLTGAALRPVTRLRESADAIVADGSDELLPAGGVRDEITDLAATLNHLIIDLRASAAREKQMVSDASHELRTPLAVLQAQLELLRTGDRTSLEADIAAAEKATTRLTRLVESLLELSRLDAGRAPVSMSVSALVDEAGEAIDRARLHAMSDSIEIDLRVAGEVRSGDSVAMSELLYGRVLDNLLSNALRAIDGHGRIVVSLRYDDAAFTTIVTDDGPGMSSEFLSRAFDRFSQQDSARAPGHGSGLGLAIVAAAAAAAGGHVALANVGDAGLAATMTIPLHRGHPERSDLADERRSVD